MSKVISVLEKMASDAAMNSESAIADLVAVSGINDGQMQAIVAKDAEQLAGTIYDLPSIKYIFPLIPAEDDEPEEDEKEDENKDTNGLLATAANG
jgi:hypothetical protein